MKAHYHTEAVFVVVVIKLKAIKKVLKHIKKPINIQHNPSTKKWFHCQIVLEWNKQTDNLANEKCCLIEYTFFTFYISIILKRSSLLGKW